MRFPSKKQNAVSGYDAENTELLIISSNFISRVLILVPMNFLQSGVLIINVVFA